MTRPAPLFFLGLAFAAALARAQPPALPTRENFHLFLLVGQSNMAGRGQPAAADRAPHARVLMLDKSGAWAPAVEPLHFDKPAIAGVGPGRAFGVTLAAAAPGATIGLIPCGVGGSPIDAWQPGRFYPPTNSHPWDDAIRRAKIALRAGTLKGILWHQGESDSTAQLAPAYAARLHALVARFRAELAAPDAPFLAGQLGKFTDAPWSEFRAQVDRAHRELPRQMARTAFVSAEGLGHKGDKVHFDTDAARELGRRYAAAYLELAR